MPRDTAERDDLRQKLRNRMDRKKAMRSNSTLRNKILTKDMDDTTKQMYEKFSNGTKKDKKKILQLKKTMEEAMKNLNLSTTPP
jgi:hypothetical protein